MLINNITLVNKLDPLVSVITLTYNHNPHIRRCIEGVLMQKTTFPFEYVIGEDCSTDGTREIVFEYAGKYPELIRVITSDKNVGSKENVKRTDLSSRGRYIADCEGDDYWIDPLKLQKQYEAIVKHNAIMVCHSSFVIFYQDGQITGEAKLRKAQDESGYLDIEDILLRDAPFHTSSIFMRADIVRNFPDWYFHAPVGDYPLKFISAYLGKVYYINEIMSCYQKGVAGSRTELKKKDIAIRGLDRVQTEQQYLQMYENFDRFSNYEYSSLIKTCVRSRLVSYYGLFNNLDYLEIPEIQKKVFKWIGFLTRLVPPRIRKKIIGKIASSLTN